MIPERSAAILATPCLALPRRHLREPTLLFYRLMATETTGRPTARYKPLSLRNNTILRLASKKCNHLKSCPKTHPGIMKRLSGEVNKHLNN
jgi:hypothetical protein